MMRYRPLVLVLVLVLAASCGSSGGGTGSGTGTGTGTGATAAGVTQPATPPQGVWLKGDFHVHTKISHDAVKLGDDTATVLALAERAGLDFVALTDHRTFGIVSDPARTQNPRVTGLIGMEWNGNGHAGAVGYTQANSFVVTMGDSPLPANDCLQQVIDEIHRQGGIFIVNHASSAGDPWIWTANGYDAIEVWNQAWAMRNTGSSTQAQVQGWAAAEGVTAPELERACAKGFAGGLNLQCVKYWEEHLNQGRKYAAVGGGDSHYLALPGNPTTRVFAASASEADILDAVRKGRTVVMRGANAPEVDFTADGDGDGVFETIVGGSVRLGRAVTFKARVVDADGGKAELIRDGQVIQTWSITAPDFEVTFTDAPSAKSWYRLDVYEPLDMSIPNAAVLKSLVLGINIPSWLTNISFLSSVVAYAQDFMDAGGPAAIWLLLFGQQMGVQISPVPSRYPRLEFPEGVSRILNVDLVDDHFARGAITTPIWVE